MKYYNVTLKLKGVFVTYKDFLIVSDRELTVEEIKNVVNETKEVELSGAVREKEVIGVVEATPYDVDSLPIEYRVETPLEKPLYWMDRNKEGLYEEGYLLTKEQLMAETDFTKRDIVRLDDGEELEGDYWSNDTFTVKSLHTLADVEHSLCWSDMDFTDTDACVEMTEDYPDYVDVRYRCSVCCYNCTGSSIAYLPNSGDDNPTFHKYVEKLGLKEDELYIHVTPEEEAAAEISVMVHDGSITEAKYRDVLREHGLLNKEVRDFQYKYAEGAGFELDISKYLTEEDIQEVLDFVKVRNGLRSLEFFCNDNGLNVNDVLKDANVAPEKLCADIYDEYMGTLENDSGALEMKCVRDVLKQNDALSNEEEEIER